ncbi:tRNA uridine 5-carboxymethylaminomethyl modification enzyme GidA [Staphylococcus aureus]|uniref:tRNA uridine 5-carboxymethylaminomethyl modification enzyme GidA n=1 Tax=Staphylococcus aureus TaxID=1280 RepID=A0A380E0C2_STAAU|nr:tRNA uridine 5-carboxymethylaminomethyl modification enzyme GidA [Staphylococcus aureus]
MISRDINFLEPEGRNTNEVYVQGLSTSLPEHVQRQMLETIPGLEKADMMRAGYAIEYDAIVPTQLWPTLETKMIKTYTLQVKLMVHLVMKKQQDKD